MAQKQITLHLTPKEERALAHLLSWLCTEAEGATRDRILQMVGADEIGNINAALNAVR